MKGPEAPRLWAGALALVGLVVYVLLAWKVRADITHFLPGGDGDSDVLLARQIAVGELSRTMVLLVDAGSAERAVEASRDFEQALRADAATGPMLAALEGGPADGFDEAMYRIYQPRRFAFAATSPEAARARLGDDALVHAAAALKRKLATPMASMLSRVAPEDPLLIVPELFERIAGRGEGLGVVDGRYVTTDGLSAALFAVTAKSSSDTTAQRPFLAAIRRVFDAVNARAGGGLVLRTTGANRHAVAAEDAVTVDIERVSIGSTVGLLAVFLLLFGSLRLPLSWLPVLAAGFLAGAAACLLTFGEIHGMTLAFGASLIGVSIDYAVHFYCHQSLAPAADGPRATMRRVWPGLVLGCATTVVGFVVLLVATFPGLREMALFSAVGLLASLAASWAFLPGLVGPIGGTRSAAWVVRWLDRATSCRGRARWRYWLPIVAALLVTVVGLPQAKWNDRIANLNRAEPELGAEDAHVMQRVVKYEQRRLVVSVGADEERALAANDRVAEQLAAALAERQIAGYRSIAGLLPSAERQRAVDAAMRSDPTTWPRLSEALAAQGFVEEAFVPFREALAAAPPPPLVAADLLGSPMASLVRPFLLHLDDGRVVALSYLHGIADQAALAARVASVPGARLLDIEAALTGAFGAYRERMTTLLAFGVLLVVALVAWRYRRLKLIALAVVPAVLGAFCTIAVLGLCGIDLTLLSLVALLMVVSMGVDYGIFLAEDEEHPGARGATQLGVVVDGLTTILGFGLLAISSHPALFSIGATAGVGVTLCLVLALCFGSLVATAKSHP